MHDLIFVSMEPWDDVWRRNQFVCAEMARRHPERKLLFVEPAQDLSHAVRRRKWGDLRVPTPWSPQGHPNITVTRPIKVLPSSLAVGRAVNAAVARRQVRRAARRLGFYDGGAKPMLWLNPHDAVHMVGRMGERATVYDITDDWITPTQSTKLASQISAQDARLCRLADAVIVCSSKLYDLKQPLTDRLYLIPNGVDAEHYAQVLNDDGPLPTEAADWPRPVFGYTGTIHPDRVDLALVETLAASADGGSVVLIGPIHLTKPDRERLEQHGNIFLPGPAPYHHLPSLMRGFDVCIVPHRMTAFTESLNPIKLWEYLASGKPIVSMDLAGFRDFPELVRLARNQEQFVAAARQAIHEHPSKADARRQEARNHSWKRRVGEIESVIEACTADHEVSGAVYASNA